MFSVGFYVIEPNINRGLEIHIKLKTKKLTFCLFLITQTFASWEIDYLKVDGCFSDPSTFDVGYPKFTEALNATGRPILLSCEWPDYQQKIGIKVCNQTV